MIYRIFLSFLVTLVFATATVKLWNSLREDTSQQISRIADSEAFAARNQLARNVEQVLSSVKKVQAVWATFGNQSEPGWQEETDVNLADIPGLRYLLWEDSANGIHFVYDMGRQSYEFGGEEKGAFTETFNRSRGLNQSTIFGPVRKGDDTTYIEVHVVGPNQLIGDHLIAVIDAEECLASLLEGESPGYALRVLWNDHLLYEQGTPLTYPPPSWVRDGLVRTSMGAEFQVVHTPTAEFVQALTPDTIDIVLLLGLLVSILMGVLTYENWRAQSRARAAERAERRLAQLNRDLETKVAERTEELANRTADLQTIADSVGHDLRNPLNTMLMNIRLIEKKYGDELSPDLRARLNRMTPPVWQITSVIERLQGLSHVTHATFQPERLDMDALVTEVFRELSASDEGPPIDFEKGQLPGVRADRRMVRILLINLLGNALKYSRESAPRKITVTHRQEQGATVYCIEDNGIGLDKEKAETLFVAFARDARSHDGLGLGLTIAARVVERHRGRIWAEGEEGKRAALNFTLEPAEDP